MKILVTGCSGLLGQYLLRRLGEGNVILGIDRNPRSFPFRGKWKQCDLRDSQQLCEIMGKFNPQVVIHAAAWVDVDGCQKNPEKAKESNETLTQLVVNASPKKAKIVYISTEQVFPGKKPYAKESDPTRPLNVYGRTKLAGEKVVQKSGRPHLIIRTNFFGWSSGRKKTFGEWLIQSLREKKPIRLFTDFYFTPIYAGLMPDRLELLLKKDAQGIVHIGGKDRVSKYEFGKRLAQLSGLSFSGIKAARMASADTLAIRPKDISLDSCKAQAIIRRSSISLTYSLRKFLQEEKKLRQSGSQENRSTKDHFERKDKKKKTKASFNCPKKEDEQYQSSQRAPRYGFDKSQK